MRKTVRKWFWVWDFDKEEAWLNEMAAKGLCLAGVGFCRYEFEECLPGEYSVRMELLKENVHHPESAKYLEFLEETGAEHVGTWFRWVFLKKKKADGEFELFSDNESRIQHLTRIIQMIALIVGANLLIGLNNLFLLFSWNSDVNILGCINLVIGVIGSCGVWKLWKKRRYFIDEQRLYE